MKILNMRTNHISNPLGFEMDNVRFSWIVENEEDSSKKQKETRVTVALDEVFKNIIFDSGFCSNIDNLSFVPNIKLEARTRYYWKVSVINDLDEKMTSHIAWFETSKMNEKWVGNWITPNMDKNIHPILGKEFNIEGKVKKARIYISGLGLYEAKINGVKIGEEYFAPGFTSYDFWVQYQTFDITNMIKNGENDIKIMLGNGWYKGRFGFDGGYTELYGDKFLAIAEIRVTLDNDEEIVLGTDESWYSFESPIEFSGIYDGEIYNANKEIKFDSNIKKNNVIETEVNTNKFQARLSLPVKIKEEIKPIEIIKTPKNETILDFGQNMTGWVKFKVREKKGNTVSLQ